MIVTSNMARALLVCLLITAFSYTGCHPVHRRNHSQRCTAKALTVTHFQVDALNRCEEL
jgi:hypothetical protein